MFDILKDIRSGALPASEIPGFLAWLVGKSFWFCFLFWFAVIVTGVGLWLVK